MASVVYEAILDSYTMKQVMATSWKPNTKHARAYNSGSVAASIVSLISGEDVINLTTCDLAGVIAAVNPLSGLVLSTANVIPYEVRAAGGTFAGDTLHHSLNFVNGLLVPVEISATQDSEEGATCKLDVHVAGAAVQTAPVTITDTVTLVAQTFVGMYDLGPVKIASTTIEGVKSSSVKFGITVEKMRYGGEVWPSIGGIYITKVEPVLSVTFEDVASAKAAGQFAATATTATAYFRKRVAGGAHVANATATNVSCTITGGMHMLTDVDGKDFGNTSMTREFQGLSWAFSSTAAIS